MDAKQLPAATTLCVSFTPLSTSYESLVSSTDPADAPLQSSPCLRHGLAMRFGASGNEDTGDSVCVCVLVKVGHSVVGESAHDGGGYASADSVGLIQVGELVDCTVNFFPCLSRGIAVDVTASTTSPHAPATPSDTMPFQVDYVRSAEGAWVACDPLPFPVAIDSLPQRLFHVLELQWRVGPGTQYPRVAIADVDSIPVNAQISTVSGIVAHATTEKGDFPLVFCPVVALLSPIMDTCRLGHASLRSAQSTPLVRETSMALAASSANGSVWRLPYTSLTPDGVHPEDSAVFLRELLFTQPAFHPMSPSISNLSDLHCFSTSPVDRDHAAAVIFLLIAATTLAALRALESRACAALLAPFAAPSAVAPFAQATVMKDAGVAVLAATDYTRTAVGLDAPPPPCQQVCHDARPRGHCVVPPLIIQETIATSFVSPVVGVLQQVAQIPPLRDQICSGVLAPVQQLGTAGTWRPGVQQVYGSDTPVTSWTAANLPSPPRLLDAAWCHDSLGTLVPVALSWTSPEPFRHTPGSYHVPAAPLCTPYNCARPLALPAVHATTEVSTSTRSHVALPGHSRLLLHLHALSQPKPYCVDSGSSSLSAGVRMPGLEGEGESVVAQTSVAGQRRKRAEEENGGGSDQIDDSLTHGKTKARERTTAYVIRNGAAPGNTAGSVPLGGTSGAMRAMALESSSDSDSWSACIASSAAECRDVVMVSPDTADNSTGTGVHGATDWSGCFGDIFGPPEVQ